MLRLCDQYPTEEFSVIAGKEQLGDYYLKNENYELAEKYFQEVTSRYHENTRSGTTGLADIKLAQTILASGQQDKYQLAYETATTKFEASEGRLDMNSDRFYYADTLANLCYALSKTDEASEFAKAALEIAEITEPQFSRHKTVGLVNATKDQLERLRLLKEKKSLATTRAKQNRAAESNSAFGAVKQILSRLKGRQN